VQLILFSQDFTGLYRLVGSWGWVVEHCLQRRERSPDHKGLNRNFLISGYHTFAGAVGARVSVRLNQRHADPSFLIVHEVL
jgi:hypothetical protein